MASSRNLTSEPDTIPYSNGVCSSTPTTVDMTLQDEIRTMTMACSVEDAVQMSIFPTGELTTKVRTNSQASEMTTSCINVLRSLFSTPPSGGLWARNSKTGDMIPPIQNLSTELICACKDGDAARVETPVKTNKMIEGALIEVETENFHSFRPLHWATFGGHLPVLKLLLSAGAQEYILTSQKMTPIHLAAIMGHLEVMTYFIEKSAHTGTDIDSLLDTKTSETLETPFHLAAAYLSPDIAERFLDALHNLGEDRDPMLCPSNYLDETPLHRAAAMNNTEAVRWFLKVKPPFKEFVQLVDKFGRSALWHAACGGSSESIMALFDGGARPILDLVDDLGRTPLVVACREGRTKAVSALLSLGANPNSAALPLGLTPCHYAALFGQSECLRLLIQLHASPSADTTPLDSFRIRPIHLAAANGWLQCVKDICDADSEADSPATHYILLDKDGACANLIAQQTLGAEETALSQGHHDIVQFLQDRRALLTRLNEVAVPTRPRLSFKPIAQEILKLFAAQRAGLVDLGTLEGASTSPTASYMSTACDTS